MNPSRCITMAYVFCGYKVVFVYFWYILCDHCHSKANGKILVFYKHCFFNENENVFILKPKEWI